MRRFSSGLGAIVAVVLVWAEGGAAQQGTIVGNVRDAASGAPLTAVQVYLPDLDLGVVSQEGGAFQISSVPAGTHTLRAQRLGYQTQSQEVTVAAGATVNVSILLSISALGLEAVIVTGTPGGTQRRAIGNVVTTVDAASLAEVTAATNMEQFLGARTAGVMVAPSSGALGSDASPIRIRGSSSPGLSNDPIVYIDGVRMNSDRTNSSTSSATSRLNDINPADIESIEIIKGPAAATLYGTEASNGVIQIITKRGVSGDASFDASLGYGLMWITDPAGKLGTTYGRHPLTQAPVSHNLYEEWEQTSGSPVYSYGPSLEASVSARGGTDRYRYFGSINRSDRTGTVPWNTDENLSGRLNLGIAAGESVNIDVNFGFNSGKLRRDGGQWVQLLWSNPGGSPVAGGLETSTRAGFYQYTPEAMRDFDFNTTDVQRRINSATLTHTPTSWLTHRLIAGADVTNQRSDLFRPRDEANRYYSEGRGTKSFEILETNLITADYSASANFRAMEGALGSQTSAGLQYYGRTFNTYGGSGEDFATAALSTVTAASTPGAPTERRLENNTVGVYFQQQMDWEQRLFLTGAVRFDDNSAFGTDFDAAVYPKLSGAWVLSESGFWNFDFFEEFRARGAWGKAGLQPDVFAASRLYQPQPGPGGVPALTPSQFGNPDLAPEVGSELELGFDASFLDGRASMAFTGYWRVTSDAIVSRPTAESLGFPSDQLINIGETTNRGTETQFDLQLLDGPSLGWDLSLSLATMKNEIKNLGGAPLIPIRRGRAHVEGFALGSLFAQKVIAAEVQADGFTLVPGSVFCDGGTGTDNRLQGGEAVPCNQAPLLYWGTSEPAWQVSLANTWSIGQSVRLYAQIDAIGGHLGYHDGNAARHTTFFNTQCSSLPGDAICKAQRSVNRAPLGFYDGGFARLRELSVGYEVPSEFASRLGLSRASINWGWRNVALLWFPGKFQGSIAGIEDRVRTQDPEMNAPSETFGGEVVTGGPPASSTNLTVRVSF
jgi:TonB-linked SusC/RagA family outer membrane protein